MEDKINVDEKAPDFTLSDTDLKPPSLREILDKNVLSAFYPGAFTAVCTKEMYTLRDSLAKLSDLNV